MSDPNIGLNCTLLREADDAVPIGNSRACGEDACLESTRSTIGQTGLKPLIIAPARIKAYSQVTIRQHWAFFDRLLAQARELVIVGTSVRDDDVLLANLLSYLLIKKPRLKKIAVVDPCPDIAVKVAALSKVKTKPYESLEAYIAR